MIDRHGDDATTAHPGPVRDQAQQGKRVSAPRQGHHDGSLDIDGQAQVQPVVDPLDQRVRVRRDVRLQLQRAWAPTWVATPFRAAEAVAA